MGNSVTQNCQRGTIFITFIIVVFFCVINIIALVKKRIDPIEGEAEGQKYQEGKQGKEGEPKKPKEDKREEPSMMAFDERAISMKAQQIAQDDTPALKVMKKNQEFELLYFPLLMLFILNIVTGTSKAFSFVNLLFTLIAVFVFNVIKAHRQCCNHVCINIIMQNLWIILCLFEIINMWASSTISMPYAIQ